MRFRFAAAVLLVAACVATSDSGDDLPGAASHAAVSTDGGVWCSAALCFEAACGDSLDNDGDGLVDCADRDCSNSMPVSGVACVEHERNETDCANGRDDDGDGLTDCADSFLCYGQLCGGPRHRCGIDGCHFEPDCGDGIDNDGNGETDCHDHLTCDGELCAHGTGRCSDSRCVHETICFNGVDDDGDGLTDCADASSADCLARDCGSEPQGEGAVCRADGACHEWQCMNGRDDDRDGFVDCGDLDSQALRLPCDDRGGTCGASGLCEH